MFRDFFRDKKTLVTGVTGVKGTWLTLTLLNAGSRVVGLDRHAPTPDSNFISSGLDDRIEFLHQDVVDVELSMRAMEGVDCVFHLAAVSLVSEARRNPWETYRSNVLGTASVLEATRQTPSVQRVVIITSDKVYQPKSGQLWVESDPLVASEPYPVSKACAEFVVADYYRQYLHPLGKHVGVARAGNVVLGGDPYSSAILNGGGHLHVDCFEALMQGRQPVIYSPKFTRPYTYGLDILSGYMSLMVRLNEEGVDGEAFNFGPREREGIENGIIASKICTIWNTGINWTTGAPRQEPFEKQSISWDKAQEKLGWEPIYTIQDTLGDVAQWYRARVSQGAGKGRLTETNEALVQSHTDAARRLGAWWAR